MSIDSEIKERKKKKTAFVKCPSCGQKIPRSTACIKCGAGLEARERVKLRKIHLYVLILAGIGIGLLFFAFYEANRITPIGSITAGMDGDNVQIAGLITDIEYDSEYEKTAFSVNDTTGEIEFYGWSDFTSDLLVSGNIPNIGDNITVEGTVDVYDGTYGTVISLVVTSTDSYEIVYVPAVMKEINAVSNDDIGAKVNIQGTVADKYTSYDGTSVSFVILTVEEAGSEITVFLNEAQISLADDNFMIPEISDTVNITGMVTYYDGDLEIIPSNTTGAISIV